MILYKFTFIADISGSISASFPRKICNARRAEYSLSFNKWNIGLSGMKNIVIPAIIGVKPFNAVIQTRLFVKPVQNAKSIPITRSK